jgi:hypothetical protein
MNQEKERKERKAPRVNALAYQPTAPLLPKHCTGLQINQQLARICQIGLNSQECAISLHRANTAETVQDVHPFTLALRVLTLTLFLARVLSCTDRPFGGGLVATGYDGGLWVVRWNLVEGAARPADALKERNNGMSECHSCAMCDG